MRRGANEGAVPPALDARLLVRVGGGDERPFSLEVALRLDRGVLVLFGPSGAGKSITLKTLAGLLRPSSGWIRVGGEVLYDDRKGIHVPSHRRRVGYVPQHASLFPFLSVAENAAFGLPRSERRADDPIVRGLLRELGLAHLARSRPSVLSGGERQRVALARALAVRPKLLLLDEPFASIDHEGRRALRRLLRETLDRHGTPAVFVTHDPEEALDLGDHLFRIEAGRVTASGSPQGVLEWRPGRRPRPGHRRSAAS